MTQNKDVMEFLTFRRMITPLIIQVLFWVGAVLTVIMALVGIIAGIAQASFGSVLAGLLFIVLGPLMVRIYCELLIVLFQIHGELSAIRRGIAPTERGFDVVPPPPVQ